MADLLAEAELLDLLLECGVEWHREMISWMSGKRLAVIWLPTTMWGMGACNSYHSINKQVE